MCEKFKINIRNEDKRIVIEGSSKEWVEGNADKFLEEIDKENLRTIPSDNYAVNFFIYALMFILGYIISWALRNTNLWIILFNLFSMQSSQTMVSNKMANLISWFFLLFIYALIANLIPRNLVKLFKRNSELLKGESKQNGEYILQLGVIEIFSYALSVVSGVGAFIAVWLGIKTLNRWRVRDNGEGPREASEINIFLFGNLSSVLIGIIGGLIFKEISSQMSLADIVHIVTGPCK